MTEWQHVTLKSICTIGDGAHGSIKRTNSGVMYLTSKNFKPDGIDLTKVDLISEGDYKKHFKADSKALTVPKENDVLLSIIGTLGAPYLVKDSDFFGLSSSVSILRPDQDLIDSKYLFYWLKSPMFQSSINMTRSGVAQSFLSLGMIGILPVRYPKLMSTQKKIAGVLSAYDDLIEVNLKRIKHLEEMAQITYEEWFVRLHFPGHESTPTNPETGLPVGWAKGCLGDIVEFRNGYAFKSDTYSDTGEYKIVTIRNVQDGSFTQDTNDQTDFLPANLKPHHHLKTGDILMSLTGNVGRVCVVVGQSYLLNQRVAKVVPKESFSQMLAYCFLRDKGMLIQLESISNGAAQQNLSPINAASLKIVVPPLAVVEAFNLKFAEIFALCCNLNVQNALLKEARDLLLPRLMTGLIDIDDYLARDGSAAVAP